MSVIESVKGLITKVELFGNAELDMLKSWLSGEELAIAAAITKLAQHGYTVTPPVAETPPVTPQ